METKTRLNVTRAGLLGSARLGVGPAVALGVALVLSIGPAASQGLGLGGGGISADVSIGGDTGIDADVSVGGSSGVNADVSVGGNTGVDADVSVGGSTGVDADVSVGGTGTGTGTTGTTGTVPKAPIARVIVLPGQKRPTSPAKTVNSVVDLDASVAGLDVAADVLSKEGTVLDICIGSCLNTRRVVPPTPDPDPTPVVDPDPTDDDDTPGVVTDPTVTAVLVPTVPGVSSVTTTIDGVTTSVFDGGAGPCGDGSAQTINASVSAAESNGNPGPHFAMSTSDLNLPVRGTELRCSAGGNSQVYNGYTVVDSLGAPIGVVHDIFFTADLDIRRLQFQGLDQRCFGLSNGKYEIEGATLRVDIPASVLK